jgi:hypothetical protein
MYCHTRFPLNQAVGRIEVVNKVCVFCEKDTNYEDGDSKET